MLGIDRIGWLLIPSTLVACSADSEPTLGDACDNDGQCGSALSCKENFVGNACTGKTCTNVCNEDSDCQAVEPKSACFKGCGDEKICMRTP
jgi:hypothetical protein